MAKMTMKEIAKLADVSQPTVSRVINGNSDVNEEIAKRVRKVIEDVNYVPNKAAQTLKRSQSYLIGISVSQIYDPFFVELIDALELKLREKGYNIILHNSRYNPLTEWDNVQNFVARQVDGIIIVPIGSMNAGRIRKLNIPTAVITQISEDFDSVGLNHVQAGKLTGEYFIHHGHRKFGYIGSLREDKFTGFASALYENGFEFDPKNYIELSDDSTTNYLIRQDIDRYLSRHTKLDFTCVGTYNDTSAVEFMKAARERGIRIPEDISVIGFDDTYLSKIMGITSVHQPITQMVENTIELLGNRISKNAPAGIVKIQMEPTLIERSSTVIRR